MRSHWTRRAGFRAAAIVMSAGLTLAACGGVGGGNAAGSLEEMDPLTLKVATLYGPDNWQTAPMQAFTDSIEEKSDGKISFEYFYAGSVLAPDEIVDGLRDGLADLAYFVQVYTPAKFPMDDWISQAAFLSDPDPIGGHLQSIGASAEWAINDADFTTEFEAQGVTPLIPRVQVIHTYDLLCTDPVTTLGEAAGATVRIGGPSWAEAAESLGMNPVSLAGEELYTGMQQGVVDCFMGGQSDMAGLNLLDLGQNFVSTGFAGFSSYAIGIGTEQWESLPLEAQQLIWDEIPTYLEAFAESSFGAVAEFQQAVDEQGVTIHEPADDLAEAAAEHNDEVLAGLIEASPDSVSDPEATVASFEEMHDKWFEVVDELGLFGLPEEQIADTDTSEWVDRVWTEVFEAHRPE